MKVALDRKKADRFPSAIEAEWEIKTISSAVKTFLRSLPQPLLTYQLYANFISSAKIPDVWVLVLGCESYLLLEIFLSFWKNWFQNFKDFSSIKKTLLNKKYFLPYFY